MSAEGWRELDERELQCWGNFEGAIDEISIQRGTETMTPLGGYRRNCDIKGEPEAEKFDKA